MLHRQPFGSVLGGFAFLFSVLALSMALPVDGGRAAKPSSPEPLPRISDFTLKDCRGKEWSLSDFKEHKLIVVAFLGVECPIAGLYGGRLATLAEQYADQGVAFVGIDPNRQDSLTELAHFIRVHQIKFPLLKDLNNRLADRLAVERVPEVLVLDEERVVRYRGRIDDQYTYGLARPRVEQNYLVAALTDLLTHRQVRTPRTEAVGCLISRVRTPTRNARVTYSNQISRILQARCVRCHRAGQIAPFALTDYDEVAGWAEMIDEVVREQRMPPWHANPHYGKFKNDARLSADEKRLIAEWVAAGAPEGDPRNLPEPVEFEEGWRIGKPDQIIYMADEPFRVPAEGEVEYQYFVVDPRWKEDKWIRATECRPGNRAVVHHIEVVAVGDRGDLSFPRIGCLSPGSPPQGSPEGAARFVPAGSKLVFEMHYTAVGTEQEDRSAIGLIFADPKAVRRQLVTQVAYNDEFCIPPGAADYRVEATHVIRCDSLLWSFLPHMHLRGKSFRYTAVYPDGRKEILLDVPRYDFNWQNIYELEEPKRLPAGTKIHCVARFDNSEENLANPDPNRSVRWGAQTWDEMMSGYFDLTRVEPIDVAPEH